jgi:hypothetical protein
MARSATGDRPQSPFVASAAVESNRLRWSAQVEAQARVMAELRVMWADLLAEPVPAHLLQFIREIESKQKGSDDDR